MKDAYSILPRRKDVTHWRVYRISEDGKKGTPLKWGINGRLLSEWPIKELSVETVRNRWGAGRYDLRWFGVDEEGNTVTLGRGKPLHLVELPDEPRATERPAEASRIPAPPVESPSSPRASGELLALAAMRNQTGGRCPDMASMLQLRAFMEERQDRARQVQQHEARLAEERHRADLEVQIERERLATKERIAMIEANAQVQARGRAASAVDPEALAEAIGRKVQEAIAGDGDGDDDGSTALAAGSSDLAKIVDAIKETLAPLLTVIVTKVMNEPAGLPGAYKPSGSAS